MRALAVIERAALGQLNRLGKELVTLLPRNVSVWAEIDRVNKPFSKLDTEIEMQGEVGITVYILKRNLNEAPRRGEYIQESDESKHLIGHIKDLGQRWQVFCSSEPL